MSDKTDKSKLRGRARTPQEILITGLKNGQFKGPEFVAAMDRIKAGGASVELLLSLWQAATRPSNQWIRGAELLTATDRLAALKREASGEVVFQPEGSSGPGIKIAPPNPGFLKWKASQAAKPKESAPVEPGALKFETPWIKPDPIVPVKVSPPESSAEEIQAGKERKLAEAIESSAALDQAELKKFFAARENEFARIGYQLPDGKRIHADGMEFSADPFLVQGVTFIKVKAAPRNGLVLSEEGILRWIEKPAPVQTAPIRQGLELWASEPMPAPEPDRHRPDKDIIPGHFRDGVFILPRRKNS